MTKQDLVYICCQKITVVIEAIDFACYFEITVIHLHRFKVLNAMENFIVFIVNFNSIIY